MNIISQKHDSYNFSKKKYKNNFLKKFLLLFFVFDLFIIIFVYINWIKNINFTQNIEIKQGETFNKFANNLNIVDKYKIKLYIKLKNINMSKLEQGSYVFSGTYSSEDFIKNILSGPSVIYSKYTVLEGWSTYDIDVDLSRKGLIQDGEYRAWTNSYSKIEDYAKRYRFLKSNTNVLSSLEGFLYPDTYFLDTQKPIVDQLIKLQLDSFEKKIWQKYKEDLDLFLQRINGDYGVNLTWYDIIILSSIVEKEERNNKNKATVAGVFLNRLKLGMRLDADITLCYGLKQPYSICTPSIIAKGIYDENNLYNTRRRVGIPPQPISNFSNYTFDALFNYKKTDNLYYLHGANGQIYYAKTYDQHNKNKKDYIKSY